MYFRAFCLATLKTFCLKNVVLPFYLKVAFYLDRVQKIQVGHDPFLL